MIDLKSIPKEPGCYLFKDKDGNIIYIGKARNLRSRVSSYFTNKDLSPKTRVLVSHIIDAEFIIVDNETEALLLENKLIKKHSPKYNISLKDAKTYAYIQLTDEKFPRILSTRKPGKRGQYFGPYTDGSARHELVQLSIKLFNLRVCRTLPKRACLNYHIGLCTAPCINNVTQEQYAKQVDAAAKFLKGETKDIIARLELEMKLASQALRFEIAQEKKRQIDAIQMLEERQKVDLLKRFDQDVLALIPRGERTIIEMFSITKGVISGRREYTFETQEDLLESFIKIYYSQRYIPRELIVNIKFWADETEKEVLEEYLSQMKGAKVELVLPQKGDKLALIELAEKNAALLSKESILKEIQEKLILPDIPKVIECFDISNLGKEHIVAGMTQWVDGKPNKNGYRKFLLKTVVGKNDDFASIREVVHRRYKRLSEEGSPMPNLIIIDGGPGQLESALHSLRRLGLRLPIIGLAKEHEEIYTPHDPEPLRFDKNSQMMLLIRRIRDSVHDFVLSYNKKRREMQMRDEFANK